MTFTRDGRPQVAAVPAEQSETREIVSAVWGPGCAIASEIAAERSRQIHVERFTLAHDDAHSGDELAAAAGVYALDDTAIVRRGEPWHGHDFIRKQYWPWAPRWWRPHDRRRDLIRAGALIVAEIERLDRECSRKT